MGDCWLLAGLSAIGEYPERVHKIFGGIKAWPTNGQFKLNMFNYGEKTKIVVDDKIPGKIVYGNWYPRYTRKSPNGAWWVPIAEKAAAKYYGSYHRLVSGSAIESLHLFTGMPTTETYTSSISSANLWTQLSTFD